MGGRWRVLRTSTGRVWLRPTGSAGPKSVSEHATAPRIKASVNSVYNSSEIDKIRYCQPNRWTEKGGPTARAEPEVVFRGTITFNYLVLVLIRYIIVVKLIKPVIAYPTVGQRKEGLRPVWRRVLRTSTGRVWFALRAHRDISRVWGNRGAWRRMGPIHHLVTNVRFRKTKSTVSVKSDFWAHRFYL